MRNHHSCKWSIIRRTTNKIKDNWKSLSDGLQQLNSMPASNPESFLCSTIGERKKCIFFWYPIQSWSIPIIFVDKEMQNILFYEIQPWKRFKIFSHFDYFKNHFPLQGIIFFIFPLFPLLCSSHIFKRSSSKKNNILREGFQEGMLLQFM